MSYDTYSPFDNSDRGKMTLLLDDQFRSFDYRCKVIKFELLGSICPIKF